MMRKVYRDNNIQKHTRCEWKSEGATTIGYIYKRGFGRRKTYSSDKYPTIEVFRWSQKSYKDRKHSWILGPEIPVSVVMAVGVWVEEALSDIGMNYRKLVVNMECYFKAHWIRSPGQLWKNQSIYQWV